MIEFAESSSIQYLNEDSSAVAAASPFILREPRTLKPA
jgi:hypothetical protein